MENAKIKNMYDLSQSIAGEYLSQFTYPWEALKESAILSKSSSDTRSGNL